MKDINKEIIKKQKILNELFDEGEACISLKTKKNDEYVSVKIEGDKGGICYCLRSLFKNLIKNDLIPTDVLIAIIRTTEIELMENKED